MSDVHVWLAPEALADDPGVVARIESLLPEDELERMSRFRAGTPRRLHLIARGLERVALSKLRPDIMPRDWCFERSESGRPSVADNQRGDLDFNLAHTKGLVALAASHGVRLGIDVERIEHRRSLEIARRYFSAREIAALEALPEDRRARRFVELWTLKEAWLKATGTGISGGLGTMTFEWRDGEIHFERAADPDAARWRFRQWSRGEHLLALAWLAPTGDEPAIAVHDVTAATLSGQEQRSEA